MYRTEYIMIQISAIPQESLDLYNLKGKTHNGYIFERVTKGVYGLPHEGWITYDALVKHLEPYVYLPSSKTMVLWKNDIHSINFALLVDDFGVNIRKKSMPYTWKQH